MEAVGQEPNVFFGLVHTAAFNHMSGAQKVSSISRSKAEWHIFEINWEEDSIQFVIDNQIYYEFRKGVSSDKWPFDQAFHIIMNVSVGGAWGGQQGIDDAAFDGAGQTMETDWVRVYGISLS